MNTYLSDKMVKTFVISAAQAIQTDKHAEKYGPDSSKGEPCIPLLKNIESYVSTNQAQMMICAIQGMDTTEMELHPSLDERRDIYIDSNRLQKLRCTQEIERTKIAKKVARVRRRIETIIEKIDEIESKEKEDPRDEHRIERLRTLSDELGDQVTEMEAEGEEISRSGENYIPLRIRDLNRKAIAADLIVPPQNKDPMTGMLEVAQSKLEKSVIFPHCKQRLKVAPKNMMGKLPRLVVSTGAVTHPNYNTTNTRGDQAEWMHQYGFCVVDVLDDRLYLPRLVPANASGTFVDMGMRYERGKKPTKARIEALVLGDLHNAQIDEQVMRANYEMIQFFSPKAVYIHDLFDGQSVTPHKKGNALSRLHDYETGRTNLEREIFEARGRLVEISKIVGKNQEIRVVLSNHDDMLKRWLESESFQDQIENKRFGGQLFYSLYDGDWPLQKAMERMGPLPNNVRFLSLRSDIRPWGYQLAAHGHKGINGAKGSLLSLKRGFGKVIMGHTHQPEINGNAISVGSSAVSPMDYQEGQPGTSMAANAYIAEGGFAQLLPIIYGKWRAT